MKRLERVAEKADRLDRVLADSVPDLSRSRLAELIRQGAVTVGGHVVTRPSAKVRVGDPMVVEVPPPLPAEAQPQDLPIERVYEDTTLVVVNKAPGMVVHPGPGHPDGTLVNALLHHVEDLSEIGGVLRPGIVHRLDRGTSGLMVVAKTDAAHQGLSAQFAAHSAGRHYLALCMKPPVLSRGTNMTELARHPTDRRRWASTDRGGKRAVTHWAVRGRAGDVGLMECRLETGRTHQIRVHLTELGHPLLGDLTYRRRGMRVSEDLRGMMDPKVERPMLHAWRLHFQHPIRNELCSFAIAPPADFQAMMHAAGLGEPDAPIL